MKKISCMFLLFMCCSLAAQEIIPSQKKDTTSIWKLMKHDGKSAWGGFSHVLTRPLSWEKEQWITAGVILGGTAAISLLDEEGSQWFQDQEENIPAIFKDFGWRSGSPQIAYGVTGSVYVFGLLTKNKKIRETGVLMVTSATTAGLIQSIIKSAVGRARPQTGEGAFSFNSFSGSSGYRSFPSGHTILSFTAAYSIGKQFKNPWVKAGIYVVGMIAPVSRLWAGAHWLSDIAFSMAISIVTVDAIDNYLHKSESYGNSEKGISWNIQAGLGRIGIIGSF